MTKNQKILRYQVETKELPQKQLELKKEFVLQIANNMQELEIFQTKNYNFFGMTDFLGEINSQIIINFTIANKNK